MKKAFLLVLLVTLSLSNLAQISAGGGLCFACGISTFSVQKLDLPLPMVVF